MSLTRHEVVLWAQAEGAARRSEAERHTAAAKYRLAAGDDTKGRDLAMQARADEYEAERFEYVARMLREGDA